MFYSGTIGRPGTNSEYHLADKRIVGAKPRTLDWAAAAALPLTAITDWEALFDRLDVRRPVPGAASRRSRKVASQVSSRPGTMISSIVKRRSVRPCSWWKRKTAAIAARLVAMPYGHQSPPNNSRSSSISLVSHCNVIVMLLKVMPLTYCWPSNPWRRRSPGGRPSPVRAVHWRVRARRRRRA